MNINRFSLGTLFCTPNCDSTLQVSLACIRLHVTPSPHTRNVQQINVFGTPTLRSKATIARHHVARLPLIRIAQLIDALGVARSARPTQSKTVGCCKIMAHKKNVQSFAILTDWRLNRHGSSRVCSPLEKAATWFKRSPHTPCQAAVWSCADRRRCFLQCDARASRSESNRQDLTMHITHESSTHGNTDDLLTKAVYSVRSAWPK